MLPATVTNLLAELPGDAGAEAFTDLVSGAAFRLERIVSRGQATPPGQWYDQDRAEWVMVVAGRAGLVFEGDDRVLEMGPGDYLLIQAHRRHRVAWTDVDRPTVWLALHFEADGDTKGAVS